jgi:BRCT domain type II-containing protein
VNETTQVNMRKLIETIPKPVPEEKLVEKAVTEIVKQDAEQLPTIAPVLKDVQPTIPATSKTILPTIVSAESKLKSRTTLKTRERSKSAKSEPSQKTKDKLSLDSILNQAKLIRNVSVHIY